MGELKRKVFTGMVVSDKMEKSMVVRVNRQVKQPRYKKTVKRSKRFMVHDEDNQCRIGDIVKIAETRPLSKRKRWRILEILRKSPSI